MTVTDKRIAAEKEFGKQIEKYLRLKKNQTPDPAYCPTLYLMWSTQRDDWKYKNIQTGKFITNPSEKIRISELMSWKPHWESFAQHKADNGEYQTNPNVNYFCRYVKPDYNLGIIEISSITIDTKRTNGPTAFTFLGARVFMSMNDRRLWAYKAYTEPLQFIKPTDYVDRVPQSYYTDWYFTRYKLKTYISDGKACHNIKVRKELYKYLQHNNINSYFNGKKEVDISTFESFSIWNFCEWLTAKKATQKAIDKEALIKTMLNAEFSEIKLTRDDLRSKLEDNSRRYYGIVKYEKWKEYDVFRFFSPIVEVQSRYSNHAYTRDITGTVSSGDVIDFNTFHWKEETRIFVHDKKLYIFERRYHYHGFSYVTAPNALNHAHVYNVHIPDVEEIKNLEMFKYISDEIQEYTDDFTKYFIMLRKPIVEQLIKINCPKIANDISTDNQVAANLKEIVGEVNAKKKTIKEIFGMTTKQIQYIESCLKVENRGIYYSSTIFTLHDIGFLYELFNNKPYYSSLNDISNIDFQTFHNVVHATVTLKMNNSLQRHWGWTRYYNDGSSLRYGPTFENLCPDDIDPQNRYKYIIKMIKMCKKADVNFQIIVDNHRMFKRLNDQFRPANMKLEYNCPSDITRIHDSLVELIAAQDAEQARINALKQEERNRELEKKMAKLDEKRRGLEYEDDTYMIRIPKKLSELTVEGTVQRICIGSYVNTHAQGNANIYFLRKKSNPDTPFFAIEERGGRIIQIHGYGNKWLGADDDSFAAVPFVRRWLRDKKISCDVKILTSKARGYSCGYEFRELPAI